MTRVSSIQAIGKNCPFVDRVFLTVFARYRRKLGANASWAWVRALGNVTGFLILPTAGLAVMVVIASYLLNGSGTPADHMRWGKIITVVAWLGLAFSLQARFSKYLRDPPELSKSESPEALRAVFSFRGSCVGLFLIWCALAVLLNVLSAATVSDGAVFTIGDGRAA